MGGECYILSSEDDYNEEAWGLVKATLIQKSEVSYLEIECPA
jgi:hypothetical protein